ncbi:unnamed protein product [Parnassius mnemosyne]|uniref:Uncharacterized protein n=1 Tax=Parnassius mnemosyne TaxID=213953 RepID=A0AAV1LIB8_9NEOP
MYERLVYILFVLNILSEVVKCTHVFKLDNDFSKIKSDQALANQLEEVLKRLKTFKVPVHPRIRLLYTLLKKGMAQYSYKTADSFFVPYVYTAKGDNEI